MRGLWSMLLLALSSSCMSPACVLDGEGHDDAGPILADGGGAVGEGEGEPVTAFDFWLRDVDGVTTTTTELGMRVGGDGWNRLTLAAGRSPGGGRRVVYSGGSEVEDIDTGEVLFSFVDRSISALHVLDIDGDAVDDLVVGSGGHVGLRFMRGLASGGVGAAVEAISAPSPGNGCSPELVDSCIVVSRVTMLDADDDGNLDAITAGPRIYVVRNVGSFIFAVITSNDAETTLSDGAHAITSATGWLDDGGTLRIVAVGSLISELSLLVRPTPSSIFAFVVDLAAMTMQRTDVVRVDEFAALDLVRVGAGAIVNGSGAGESTSFSGPPRAFVVDVDAAGLLRIDEVERAPILAGDVDGDGRIDKVYEDGSIDVALPDGGYALRPVSDGGTVWGSGDVDGDGDIELVGWRHR